MKTKIIPTIIMLIAGAITSIVTYIEHYDLKSMTIAVFVALVVFYTMGCIAQKVFDSFKFPDEDTISEEGEVIEKEIEELEEGTAEEKKDLEEQPIEEKIEK